MGTRTRTTAVALLSLAAIVAAGGLAACRGGATEGAGSAPAARPLYHCPMHPTYVSDRPGKCPICKMDLVPIEPASGAAASPGESSDPAATGAAAGGAAPPAVAGRAMVALSPERRQLLGVRSEPVTRRPLERTIRTVGRVAMDERRVHHVHTKYEAYVEELYVNFVGQQVRRGEPLAALYSPELVATQQEYLLALRAQEQLAGSGVASASQGGRDLVQAARQRLLFWDMAPHDIEALERTGKAGRTVRLYASHSGFVIGKTAIHGMRVTPADTLFDIADLSEVWILADVYETDLASVGVGMAAVASLPYEAGRSWSGRISYVNPLVEPATRTIKVRIEVPNPDTALKPDMFVDVVLRRDLGTALFVPDSAVLRQGERRIVFLDRGDGRLDPREVALGERVEGGYAVRSGLAENDRVVTSANFLIDSESSLKAALSAMGAPSPSPSPATPGHRHGAAAPAAPRAAPTDAGGNPTGGKPTGGNPAGGRTVWYCPMDTDVVSDAPGSCPRCGMDLVRKPAPAKPPKTAPAPPAHRH